MGRGGEGAEGEEQKGKGKGGRGAFTSMIAFCDVGEDPRGGKCKDILYTVHQTFSPSYTPPLKRGKPCVNLLFT